MVILNGGGGGGGVIADLNRTIILMLAHAHCVVFDLQACLCTASNNSVNTRHQN